MKKNLKVSILLSYMSMFLGIVVSVLYTPFMLRKLGQQQYGLYNMAASVISYLNLFDLGLGNAVVRYATKYRAEKRDKDVEYLYGMFMAIFAIISFITITIGFILVANVQSIYTVSTGDTGIRQLQLIMTIMVISLAVSFSGSVYSSIITSYEEFTFLKLTGMISTVLNPIIMIPLLLYGYKAVALSVVALILNLLIILFNCIYVHVRLKVKIRFRRFDKNLLKEIIRYSAFIFLGAVVDQLYWNTDKIILGITSGETAVALYSVGSQIHTYFQQFSWSISNVFFPRITKMVTSGSNEELYPFFLKVGRIQFFVLFLIYSGFLIFGMEFIKWWAGTEYEVSYYIAVIVISGAIIPLIQNMGVHIVQAMNKHAFRSVCYFCIAIINAVSSYFFALKWQGIGCAICTYLSLLLGHGIAMNWFYNYKIGLNIKDFWKNIAIITLKFLPLVCMFAFLNHLFISANILVLGGKILVYSVSYCLVGYFYCMNSSEKELIMSVIRKVKG